MGEKWDVWLAHVGFEGDIGSKERPVVVLSDKVTLCICIGVKSESGARAVATC
ncbi:MAG: hypothetical protein FWH47_01310 [Methanomassiliicoccaceae archaeon]|nr:hypothetical protein [Methanomassiliicoccaceae archaeon]